MGAWIETDIVGLHRIKNKSHPTWVRGLKLLIVIRLTEFCVAPYVGAWIETGITKSVASVFNVAPYVGAWIETLTADAVVKAALSHPTWVRGLKHGMPNAN